MRDGTDTTGRILDEIGLAAGESGNDWMGDAGVYFATGLYLDRVSGSIEGAAYARVLA
jgi:hypothetical protein